MINKETPRDGFLFGDHNGPWTTEHLTRAMTRETSKRIGFRMTTQEYRHIAIAIDRKFIRGPYAEEDGLGLGLGVKLLNYRYSIQINCL